MQTLNINTLLNAMLTAFKNEIEADWPTIQALVEAQLTTIASAITDFTALYAVHTITQEEFSSDIEESKLAFKTALLTQTGLTELMLNKALLAALAAVKDLVNSAVGFALL